MCRFVIYHGKRILLSDILTKPEHSLISQASRRDAYTPGASDSALYDETQCNKRNHSVNADGFGLAYYDETQRLFASLFKSVTPAWSDRNLAELCEVQYTDLLFAHIRAASSGMLVSQSNCHPFRRGQFVFMHNGAIGGFRKIRRNLLSSFNDEVFKSIRGTTDSEHAFALFLSQFQQEDVMGPEAAPDMMPAGQLRRLEPEEFVRGLRWTIIKLMEFQKAAGMTYQQAASSLNFAVSDGQVICVSRCRTHSTQDPPTLYYAQQKKCPKGGKFDAGNRACGSNSSESGRDGETTVLDLKCKKNNLNRSPSRNYMQSESDAYNKSTNHVVLDGCSKSKCSSCIISSEPLDYVEGKWKLIPKDHMLLVHGNTFQLINLRLPTWDEIGTVEATPCIAPNQNEPMLDDDFSLDGSIKRTEVHNTTTESIRRRKNKFRPPPPLKLHVRGNFPKKDRHVGAFSAGFPVSPRAPPNDTQTARLKHAEKQQKNASDSSPSATTLRLRRSSEESRRKQMEEYRWQQSLKRTVLTSVIAVAIGTFVGWLVGSYGNDSASAAGTEVGTSSKEARTDQILVDSQKMASTSTEDIHVYDANGI